MKPDLKRIAALEWANYTATAPSAEVTPGLELTMRGDLVITSSALLPMPDANHACLLRTTPEDADTLIEEIVVHFAALEMPATIYLSPACTPEDLPRRLVARGFAEQKEREAWMVFDELSTYPIPEPIHPVTEVTEDEVETFAQVYLRAFDMPLDYLDYVVPMLAPSVSLPNVHHYLIWDADDAVGCCSVLQHEQVGVLGSTGVLPGARNQRQHGTSLIYGAARDAKAMGVDDLILQTGAGKTLERLLRIYGFKRLFTRTCYVAPV